MHHEDPRIWQDHQETSHFQNGDTFERWFKKLVPLVVARRGDEKVPIVLILDAAEQHKTDAVKALMKEHNIIVVGIPPKMTHVFQPADQFIICNLKAYVQSAWFSYVQSIFRTESTYTDAVRTMYTTSAPVVKVRKYEFFREALAKFSLDRATVLASWAKTSILETCFGVVILHQAGKHKGERIIPVIQEMREAAVTGGVVPQDVAVINDDDGEDDNGDDILPSADTVPDEVLPEEEDHEEFMDVAHHLPVEPVLPPPVLPKEKITKKQQAALDKEKKAAERPANTQVISKWFKPIPKQAPPALDDILVVPERPF